MAKKKNKKVEDVRDMDAARLKDELAALKKEAFNLRFQQATGQLEKPSRIRDVRRRIARVNTFLRQKQESAAQA
jgi:large subunit ribosomal protein L29